MRIDIGLLKRNAWNSLKGIYWFMVAACFVAMLIGVIDGAYPTLGFNSGYNTVQTEQADMGSAEFGPQIFSSAPEDLAELLHDPDTAFMGAFLGLAAVTVITVWVLSLLFSVFVTGPASVSFARLTIAAVTERETKADYALFGFKNCYIQNVKTMFLRSLYQFLWTLPMSLVLVGTMTAFIYKLNTGSTVEGMVGLSSVAFIAGIGLSVVALWKRFQYLLVPYIAAENPGIGAREAIRLSSEMMQGFKLQAVLLRLSFIGWYFLGALLCGIGIVFVEPYYQATVTLLYEELKVHYNRKGIEVDVTVSDAEE